MNNINKLEEFLAENEFLSLEEERKARKLFFKIIENDEIKTASDAYEFGRIWQTYCAVVNFDGEDFARTSDYLITLLKRFEDDKELSETFKENLGIEL